MSDAKTKNTMPDVYDETPAGEENTSQEDILMTESELLQGLIAAGMEKDNESAYEKIVIKRSGKKYFEFRIRPVSEEESLKCHDHATKFAPRKKGQPKREIETNQALFRSWLIYTATVDEDREKLWNNKKAQEALDAVTGVDMIDAALLSGEKDRIIDRINDISGYGEDDETPEETAKK